MTTDFGTRDGYVGAVKGVLARNTDATVVDIAHDVPRGDVAHAAWVVATSTREFPYGSIHVVVVDPGVGGARRGVIVNAEQQWYVGPDNGVFTYAYDAHAAVWSIETRAFRGRHVSPTFHGRDVFAHAAAALARGVDPAGAGPQVRLSSLLPWGVRSAGEGRIVHVDHYGNLISDLPAAEAGSAVTIVGRTLAIQHTYEDVGAGQLLAYVGSVGTIEIAVRDGRADGAIEAPRGTLIRPAGPGPYR
ncbi:MAG: SAM-dependent chlorinase/fluorinase [Deltaproteobacteria bacterium]|nr:SAM-dependent chlorinase/fluorinase [Deltaproteobacteria bacterium]